MKKFIYAFDNETKEKLLKSGFCLLNTQIPYIFRNNQDIKVEFDDDTKFYFSDVMQF